jgi:hypothetical protein
MNTPEIRTNTEHVSHTPLEGVVEKGALEQAHVDRVAHTRVESLRTLVGRISPQAYESLVAKIGREKETLQGFVSRKERAKAVQQERAQDLDERYFIKKRIKHSVL